MEYIELELLTDEKVSYRYYPNGKEAFGIVSLMRETGKCVHDLPCPDAPSMFARQAWSRIKKYQREGEFPERALVAWY